MTPVTDWKSLSHAYGEASDIPALIAQLSAESTDPSHPLWEDLCGNLCHQGSVYSASYAALPLLLERTEALPPEKRVMAVVLMSNIVASNDLRGIERRPLDVIDTISRVARRLTDECVRAGKHDGATFVYLLQAACAFDGDVLWGRHLEHLVDGDYPGRCPSCRHDLYLAIGRYGFFATAEEWVGPRNTNAVRIPIQPTEPAALAGRAAWLHETAVQHDQSEVVAWIRHLFGNTQCPACRQALDIAPALTASQPRNDD
jgi:hypothetical protein